MDNLPAHKPARVRELIEERGCELIYLPAYSPDLNPIEEAFSKVKDMLRRAGARTKEALLEVLGEALSAVSVRRRSRLLRACWLSPTSPTTVKRAEDVRFGHPEQQTN